MKSIVFWNKPPEQDRGRSIDPLGFDALREAMADILVPLLTNATRHVDDYIWTLIGLKWACENTGSSIDKTIFNDQKYGFAIFERALKQYWYKKRHKIRGLGIKRIKEICKGAKPDVFRPILVDQRATGLLGSYIVSLRGMGLVENNSLCINDDIANQLLGDATFRTKPGWLSSWDDLIETFNKTYMISDFRAARKRLGVKMFGENQAMGKAASSVLKAQGATSWVSVYRRALDEEQSRLAAATKPVIQFEKTALDHFNKILQGQWKHSLSENNTLRLLANSFLRVEPYPISWHADNPLRIAISNAVSSIAKGENPAEKILSLHMTVMRKVRHNDPWISRLGERPAEFQSWHPGSSERDFRFVNLKNIIKNTGWKLHAFSKA